MKIIAHRGASKDALENTLQAFNLAWEQGADAVECDVHLTKDGQIVCIHDANTKRVSNTNLVVRESTLSELREVKLKAGGDYSIPTLSEVLSAVPEQKGIYIEVKCGPEVITPLLKAIKASGLNNDQITVICFDKNVIKTLKANARHFRTGWLCSFKKSALGEVTPSLSSALATLEQTRADGLYGGKDQVSEAIVKGVMEKGYEYAVWTVDDPETALRFRKWGVKSLITNTPEKMINKLSGQEEQL